MLIDDFSEGLSYSMSIYESIFSIHHLVTQIAKGILYEEKLFADFKWPTNLRAFYVMAFNI